MPRISVTKLTTITGGDRDQRQGHHAGSRRTASGSASCSAEPARTPARCGRRRRARGAGARPSRRSASPRAGQSSPASGARRVVIALRHVRPSTVLTQPPVAGADRQHLAHGHLLDRGQPDVDRLGEVAHHQVLLGGPQRRAQHRGPRQDADQQGDTAHPGGEAVVQVGQPWRPRPRRSGARPPSRRTVRWWAGTAPRRPRRRPAGVPWSPRSFWADIGPLSIAGVVPANSMLGR